MPNRFQVRAQPISIIYDPGQQGFVDRLIEQAARGGDEAPLRARRAPDNSVFLVSATGGTQLIVGDGNIRGQTRYFADFVKSDAYQHREDYTTSRLRYVLDLVERAGGQATMVAVSSICQAPLSGQQAEMTKARIASMVSAFSLGDTPVEEFNTRVAVRLGERCFVNTSLSWFQTRSFTFQAPPNQQVINFQLREWESVVEEQGLELVVDANNRAGLFGGKSSWTVDELLEVVTQAFPVVRRTIEKWESFLEEAAG